VDARDVVDACAAVEEPAFRPASRLQMIKGFSL